MTDHIIKWRDSNDLSKGFVIDLDNGSAGQVFRCIYTQPHLLVNAFSDAFLLMRYSPAEAEELSQDLYKQTRDQMDQFIDRMRATPYLHTPANTRPQ